MESKKMPPFAEAAEDKNDTISDSYISEDHQKCQDLVSFTLYTKENGILTKTISIDDSGKLIKDSSECWMSKGTAETITMPFSDLPGFLKGVRQNQAIGLGICSKQRTKICSLKEFESLRSDDYLTRTLSNFSFPAGQPGLMLLDADSDTDHEALIQILTKTCQGMEAAAMVIKPSVSAGLFRKSTGQPLPGSKNVHIYFWVKDASDIPRFGKVLHQRLIMGNYGRVEFAKDGKVLIRTIVDQFVYSPERLDFAAPPNLIGDIEQAPPDIQCRPGEFLDTSELEDLIAAEVMQYESILRDLRKNAEIRSKELRAEYIEREGKKLARQNDMPLHLAREIIADRTENKLGCEDILTFDDGTKISVKDILKDPEKFHGSTMPDPIEPEYGGGRNKAMLFHNTDTGSVIIHSFAHGGRVFRLLYDYPALKCIIEEGSTASLLAWKSLFINSDLDDTEKQELLKLIQKKIGGSVKKMLNSLKEANASTKNHKESDDSRYEFPEWADLNLKYGFAMVGTKASVIEEKYDDSLKSYTYIAHRPSELEKFYENRRVPCKSGKNDDNVLTLWMKCKHRNTFSGVEFRPDPTVRKSGKQIIQQGGVYNIWQGYTVKPIKGDCSLILQHIKEVWCNNDQEMSVYVLNWIADMFQHPYRQGKTALVLRSGQGAGKNIIADNVVGRLLGCHALIATRKEDFLGRFNGLLGQSIFVFANEAVWAGDKEKQGTLKALITDPFLTIEKKFQDSLKVRNCTHLLFASNESWVAPTDVGDRRFVYPDVSDHRRGDSDYFKKLAEQIEKGGREAFLHEMLNRDLTGVDLTKLPQNQSAQRLTDQLQTASSHIRFLYDLLTNPCFDGYTEDEELAKYTKEPYNPWDGTGWEPPKELFYRMYIRYCGFNRFQRPSSKDVLIKFIIKDVPGLMSTSKTSTKGMRTTSKTSTQRKRVPLLKFLPLNEARDLFMSKTKLDVRWED